MLASDAQSGVEGVQTNCRYHYATFDSAPSFSLLNDVEVRTRRDAKWQRRSRSTSRRAEIRAWDCPFVNFVLEDCSSRSLLLRVGRVSVTIRRFVRSYIRIPQLDRNQLERHITFMGRMDARFHGLLIEKGTRALLLFSYWLALISKVDQWWIVGRARHECVAIFRFLRNDPDPRLRVLLEFPANTYGIDLETGGCIKPNF